MKRFSLVLLLFSLFLTDFSGSCYAAVFGDVNGDGFVNAVDARASLRAAVSLDPLSAAQRVRADADHDGVVRAADARIILRVAVNLQTFIHDYSAGECVVLKAAGCGAPGIVRRYCTCGEYEETAVPPTGEHTFALRSVSSSESDPGNTVKVWVCVDCGTEKEYVPDADADAGDSDAAASVSAERNPTDSGRPETEKDPEPSNPDLHTACDHLFPDDPQILLSPTCTKPGRAVFVCALCGAEREASLPAVGHESVWTVDKQPTCLAGGLRSLRCSRCGILLQTELLKKLPHAFGEWQTDADGKTQTRRCATCEETESRLLRPET